ncbi:MAG: penicillin-binding transpeptidase domain-containing protein, partial [Chitinophagales bacterium]
ISISTDSVYAIPAEIKNSHKERQVAHKLAAILDLDEEKVYQKITKNSRFVWIKRQVVYSQSSQLKKIKKNLPGIGFTEETRRFYPKGKVACHILGICGIDNVGLDGIDLYYDDVLGGQDGRVLIEYDALNLEIPEATHRYVAPKNGSNLVLTIDESIQHFAERELDEVVGTRNPKSACAIVMDPRTGEILALATRPNFDPNHYNNYPSKNRRNFAVSDAYEPGSTMKILTAAAAMEEGAVKLNSKFYCPGYIKVGKESISCAAGKAHGSQSFKDVVDNSCNTGFVTIGLNLGIKAYYRNLRAFGFGQKTGIELPGEAGGIIVPESRCKQIDLATMSMGQANAITAIQLISAMSAIANDGILMKPHLVKEFRDSDGKVIKRFSPTRVRRVMSKETANELSLILESVVSNGTGSNAYVEGYRIAGKTGTAQKIAPGGGYLPNEYVASFLGFAPANNPSLVCMVVIDSPQGGAYYGGLVAAPVFKDIMQDSLRYMEIPLSELPEKNSSQENNQSESPVVVPNIINLSARDAQNTLLGEGLEPKFEGEGDLVWDQVPKAYSEVKKDSVVIVYLSATAEKSGTGQVTVPDLEGKSMKETARILSRLGLRLRPDGSGLAASQKPVPGTRVKVGSTIKVVFKPLQ